MLRAVSAKIEKFIISLDVQAFIAFNFLRGVVAGMQIRDRRFSRLEKWFDRMEWIWSTNMSFSAIHPYPGLESCNAYSAGLDFLR